MTMYDARGLAWMTSWKYLLEAEKQRTDGETQSELHWSLLTQAGVYAQLASVDTPTGLAAGAILNDEAEQASQLVEKRLEDMGVFRSVVSEDEQRRVMFENTVAKSENRESTPTCDCMTDPPEESNYDS